MSDEYMTEAELATFDKAVQVKTNAIIYLMARAVQSGQRDVTAEEVRRNNPDWTDDEVVASFAMYRKMLTLSAKDIATVVSVSRDRLNDLGLDPVDHWRH